MDKSYDIIILFQNAFIFIRPRAANFAEIIKTLSIFIKTTLEVDTKLKELEITY